MPGREIIQIHIGQAGVQIANACWELYCLEHAIKTDGTLFDRNHADDCYSPFFSLTATGQAVPRVIMMDLEPSVIDEIRTGFYRNLFNPSQLLTGKEDAANNYARGRFNIGPEMLELALDRTRKIVEECANMQGFIIFRAYGGGTGGGLGSLFLQSLNYIYSKATILEFVIFPSPRLSSIIVEPYNTVFSTNASSEFHDVCFIMDNEAIYDILLNKLENPRPTFTNVNRLLGQVVSNVTASLRFEGAINVDLQEFQTNLVPYKRIHYPLVTFSPFVPVIRAFNEQSSIASLTNACFEPNSQMIRCDPRLGKYMSCCLLYRGNVTPTDVNNAIVSIKSKKALQFVDWSPAGFKVGINYMPPVEVPGGDLARITRAVTMVANNTAIRFAWQKLLKKFNLMYDKRAFVHHYIEEGMYESDFSDAKENLKSLIMDYQEVEKDES